MSLSTIAVVLAMINVWLPQQPASVWDAVYTSAQAERGKLVYGARCIRCHATDFQGVRSAALAGDGFIRNWEARSVGRLFRMIRDTMPPDGTTRLTEDEQIDTVAFLLQQNGFPAGATELSPDPAVLGAIQIKSRTPSPLRTGALVQVSGCLAQDADGWLLTNGTDLETTSLEDHPPNRASRPRVRGDRVVRLMNVFPNPAPHRDHTMLAKGFLVRDGAGDRVNVATLEMIEASCGR